ncbi:MAG: hypothetical protein RDV48_20995 [Candidatus Eremiobacteraeota bacterium]|nr:hypothetical protein [Candidatus Eremiobacteraeota bacterium]
MTIQALPWMSTSAAPANEGLESTPPQVRPGLAAAESSLQVLFLRDSVDRRFQGYHGIIAAEYADALDARRDAPSDGELRMLFGAWSGEISSLLKSRSDVKIGDLARLSHRPDLLAKVLSTLNSRPDLPFASLMHKNCEGKLSLDMTELDTGFRVMSNLENEAPIEKYRDEDLELIFGMQGKMVRDFLTARKDIRLNEIIAVRNDKRGLPELCRLLAERRDFAIGDVLHRSPDGTVSITWSVSDDISREIMGTRRDVKPKELSRLFAYLVKAFDGNPQMARRAYLHTAKLLKQRSDISPDSVGRMVSRMSDQLEMVRPQGPMAGRLMNATKLEMIESSAELLSTRRDLGTDDMTRLSESMITSFGDKNDAFSLRRIGKGFKNAAEMLRKRPDAGIGQVQSLLCTLDFAVPGRNRYAMENKASLFGTVSKALAAKPYLQPEQVQGLIFNKAWGRGFDNGFSLLCSVNRILSALPGSSREPGQKEAPGAKEIQGGKDTGGEQQSPGAQVEKGGEE